MVNVSVHVSRDALMGSLFGLVDFFQVTNSLAKLSDSNTGPVFDCQLVSHDGLAVVHRNGMTIPVRGGLRDAGATDLIYLPALSIRGPGDLQKLVQANKHGPDRMDAGIASAWRPPCGGCTGTVLLAESGLLDDRQATATWWLRDSFQRRYPRIRLRVESLVEQDGGLFTAGASSAWLNLALRLIAVLGNTSLASLCAKTLLVDPNRGDQAPFAMLGGLSDRGDDLVVRLQVWMQANLTEAQDLIVLAQRFAISPRSLIRRFKQATGHTPGAWLQQLRVEAAKKLLESTDLNIDLITQRVGYTDLSSFRRLFRKYTHVSPGEYRRRVAMTTTPMSTGN